MALAAAPQHHRRHEPKVMAVAIPLMATVPMAMRVAHSVLHGAPAGNLAATALCEGTMGGPHRARVRARGIRRLRPRRRSPRPTSSRNETSGWSLKYALVFWPRVARPQECGASCRSFGRSASAIRARRRESLAASYVSARSTSSGKVAKTLERRAPTKSRASRSAIRHGSSGSPIGISAPTATASGHSSASSAALLRSCAPSNRVYESDRQPPAAARIDANYSHGRMLRTAY